MTDHLTDLENESIFIIREAYAKIKNLALLWSMGKDSTILLHLVKKAFLGHCPVPLVHIDESYEPDEMIAWRDDYVQRNKLRLIVGQNRKALSEGMGPQMGRLVCCGALKTQALQETVAEHKIQGLMVGIRRDEEGSRGKERIVSPRSSSGAWAYKDQPAEIWNYYNLHGPKDVHLRVHPILHWTELNVWEYILQESIEVIPLYFARDGKRYRSLGCAPCTGAVESGATNVEQIIEELKISNQSERAGRAHDQEETYALQKLRSSGFM
ncbi:MAG: sulfate adenylyltransferase subunit CysD [Leptolyngbya sp.]|nr:sulfate adenylyltransferase subunit CysD [Candidatus Melainabacteria bacterium]